MIEKIFKAYDVRATYPNPLNEEAAWKVGHATAQFLKRSRQEAADRVKLEDTIVVGRDMRPSSPTLAKALIDGISSVGMNVIDVGMIDTSFMYFAINHLDAVGGIQTTASHNPIQYNGFKISGPKARPIGAASGLDDIKRIASSLRRRTDGPVRQTRIRAICGPNTASMCCNSSNSSGRSGSSSTPATAWPGRWSRPFSTACPICRSFRSFLRSPAASPTSPIRWSNKIWTCSRQRIRQDKPDLGVCFDGDADRCIFVDENQKTIGCDIITALLAQDFLQMPRNKGSTIVYDLRSSHVVADEVKAAGGVPRRDRVGHAFIKKTMAETKAVFGGELSGHFYFRDNFYADSGAIAFARVLSVLSAQSKPAQRAGRPAASIQPERRSEFPGRGQRRQNPRTGRRVQEKPGRLPGRHHRRSGRLVVQRPQEQHRAAAASEPRSEERRK